MSASMSAFKRLQRDVKELHKEPVPNVYAVPIHGNLFAWSVNMVGASGKYAGVPIHLHMEFPDAYPAMPPRVTMMSEIGHPNVFSSGYICLDMIKEPEYYSKPYQGWSSTYTLSAILMQLYGFLLVDDSIEQEYGGRVQRAEYGYRSGHDYARRGFEKLCSCACGHKSLPPNLTPEAYAALNTCCYYTNTNLSYFLPHAPLITPSEATAAPSCHQATAVLTTPNATATPSEAPQYLDLLDDGLLRLILSHLEPPSLWRLIAMKGRLAQTALDCLQRREQQCFYSKRPGSETILGFGISRQWHHNSSSVKSLSTAGDYLSVEAFEGGVRRSAWNHPFDAFLPLYLNPQHGSKALAALPAFIAGMQQRSCTQGRLPTAAMYNLPAKALLTVMAQLLNSLVVELVDTKKDGNRTGAGGVSRHMSDAALQTFCHLHHLLLAAALQPGSQLIATALQEVKAFVGSKAARHKSRCPDLGVLLVQLLLVPKEAVPWGQLAPALLQELLARQVLWAIRDRGIGDAFGLPHRENTNATGSTSHDQWRLRKHFESGGIGLRNVMLQAWFANALARPATLASCRADLTAIKASYDACSGMPPLATFQAFNKQARNVLAAAGWVDFLRVLRLGLRAGLHPARAWVAVLRQAVVDSWAAGYHQSPALVGPQAGVCYLSWAQVQPVGVLDDRWL